jgi:protein tyrosine/serine phosphatase
MNRKRWKRWHLALAGVLFPVILTGAYLGFLRVSGNFHPVVAGEIYRSGQPSPARIARYKAGYGIKSIINLRGSNPRRSWYRDEIAASRRLGIAHYDFRMSARHDLTRQKALRLIALMEKAEKPVLIHCMSGADRSGLATVLYLAATGRGEEEAEGQISLLLYGHLGIPYLSATYAMRATFEHLEPWFGYHGS